MEIGYLHQSLNHFPAAGVIFGLALLVAAMALRNGTLTKASLWAFSLLALLNLTVYLTGEPAEEIVTALPGVHAHLIEAHEDFALWGLISTAILGALSLAGLLLYRETVSPPRVFIASVLILSLFAGGVMVRTAFLGSGIRHRNTAAAAHLPSAAEDKGRIPARPR